MPYSARKSLVISLTLTAPSMCSITSSAKELVNPREKEMWGHNRSISAHTTHTTKQTRKSSDFPRHKRFFKYKNTAHSEEYKKMRPSTATDHARLVQHVLPTRNNNGKENTNPPPHRYTFNYGMAYSFSIALLLFPDMKSAKNNWKSQKG
jgi:hypothetical protein